jgi:hypothetical protein
MSTFSLNDHQLGVAEIHHNLPPSSFYEQARKTQLPPYCAPLPFISILDVVAFVDIGNVYSPISDFSFPDLRKTAGFGLRIDRRAGQKYWSGVLGVSDGFVRSHVGWRPTKVGSRYPELAG